MTKELLKSLELNRIYQMDCLEGMKLLPEKSIDLIVTDPPYGINYQSNSNLNKKKRISNDDKIDYRTFGEICFNKLKNNSHAYFFTRFDVYPEHYKQLSEIGFTIKGVLIGEKMQSGGLGDLKGSFVNNVEWIIFAHKGRKEFNNTKLIKNTKNAGSKLNRYANLTSEYKKRFPTLWKVNDGYPEVVENSSKNKHNPHPTPKNPKYIEWIIQLSSNENDIVLDPFMGSGTTALACINTNRKFIGFEIEQQYIEITNKRIESTYKELNEQKLEMIDSE